MEQEEKKWCVYCHTNKINGKKYIGITSQKPEKRWCKMGQGYKGQVFYNSIEKHGWDNFEHDILFKELEEDEAKKKEIELISKYKTKDKKFGYNLTDGGEGALGFYPSVEARERASIRCLEIGINRKPITQYTLDGIKIKDWDSAMTVYKEIGYDFSTICKCCKGKLNNSYGFIWRYSIDKFDKYKYEPKSKIIQYDLNGKEICRYNSSHNAYMNTNIRDVKISNCCKGMVGDAGGFVWRYETDPFDKYEVNLNKNYKTIQLTLDGEFIQEWDNMEYILNSINKSCRRSILDCKNGKRAEHIGFKWVGEYDYKNKTELYYTILKLKKQNNKFPVVMIDIKTAKVLKIFKSVTEAGIETNTPNTSISTCCSNNLLMAGGFYWRKLGDDINKEYILNIPNMVGSSRKPIIMIDPKTKKELMYFNSLCEATLYCVGRKVSSSAISYAVNGKKELAYGYCWKYQSKL